MRLFLSLIDAVVGFVGSFLGAMNTTQLAEMAAVTRRWLSRIALAIWPDVTEPADTKPRRRRPPRAR